MRLSNDDEGTLEWWIVNEQDKTGNWQIHENDQFEVMADGKIKLCKPDSCEFIGTNCKQLAVAPLTADEKALWSLKTENGEVWQW